MKRRNAALAFILIAITIDFLSFGIIAPVLPKLVLNFLGGRTADAALMFGIFGTVFAVMQFVFAPVFGILSDRFGRRPILIISTFGLGLDYVVMALAPAIGWLFIGRVISGITTATVTTANAYITDITSKDKRAGAMGLIGAAFGFGFIAGPALGGVLGNVDPRLPFWVAAALSVLNGLYGLFVLPESLAPQNRTQTVAWRRANPLGSLNLLRSHPELFRLAAINFVEYIAHEVLPVVFVLYAIYRYSWNQAQVGWSLAVVGLSVMIVQAGFIQPVVSRIGERRTLLLGLICGVVAFAAFGLAPTGQLMLATIPLMALWGLAGAPAQSLMTHRVSVSEQGELQGALASMRGIAMIVGPGLFSWTFAFSIDPRHAWQVPGAAWFLAASLMAITVGLAINVSKAAEMPLAEPVNA
jgi:MFS transporter, DHA1 family, tetracycline resistance protein